jgi:hypothetical protein
MAQSHVPASQGVKVRAKCFSEGLAFPLRNGPSDQTARLAGPFFRHLHIVGKQYRIVLSATNQSPGVEFPDLQGKCREIPSLRS